MQKIIKAVPDFNNKVHFDICDLQKYDDKAIEKVTDENQYTEIANINLHTMVRLYGGEDVRIYQSKKENGHYVFWRHCWGD